MQLCRKVLTVMFVMVLVAMVTPQTFGEGPEGSPVGVYGYVTLDGSPVSEGTTVRLAVTRDGQQVVEYTTETFNDDIGDGKYLEDRITSPPALPGDMLTVSATYKGVEGQSSIILEEDPDTGTAWGLNMVNLTLSSPSDNDVDDEELGGVLGVLSSLLVPMIVLFVVIGAVIFLLSMGEKKGMSKEQNSIQRPERKRSR